MRGCTRDAGEKVEYLTDILRISYGYFTDNLRISYGYKGINALLMRYHCGLITIDYD